ncbi:hypothetical protein [Streptomyces sp. NPDC002994]|uniref:hypothetical protein n=1 Tax=Streptomyces sp. NPDC002994 TaxID=3154441 RepID=UPI0033B9439F
MAAENQEVLQDRYWLQVAWEEYGDSVYWQAFDSATRSEVFVQQLRPRSRALRAHRKAGSSLAEHSRPDPGEADRLA